MDQKYLERMKEYLKDDYENYLKSLEEENIRAIKLNDNYFKEDSVLSKLDFNIEKINNIENAFKIPNDIKLGFNAFHHAGLFYSQDPSAMLPALLFGKNDEVKLVLDLCAAPGGKTIELANLYPNATIIANEIDHKRAKILYSNIERMGLKNVVITNNDSSVFLKNFSGAFDLILVDAPCSGEGMFRKYDAAISNWSLDNVYNCAKRDKEILESAVKLLKNGGKLIYSTCTFSKEEDEEMIEYLTDKYNFCLEKVEADFSCYLTEGFIKNTYRIYPHNFYGEGQFMALLTNNLDNLSNMRYLKTSKNNKLVDDFIKDNLDINSLNYIVLNDNVYYINSNIDLSSLHVINPGVKMGTLVGKIFKPDHQFFKAFHNHFNNTLNLDITDKRVEEYLKCNQINADISDGYGVLLVNGIPLGGFKAKNNLLNNLYPKVFRNM